MADMADPQAFLIFATGTIESAIFPLGPESSQVFCRFEIVTGSNWDLVSGITSGISQAAMPKHANDKIVFNIPFECIYRSTNPFGCKSWHKYAQSLTVFFQGPNCSSAFTERIDGLWRLHQDIAGATCLLLVQEQKNRLIQSEFQRIPLLWVSSRVGLRPEMQN